MAVATQVQVISSTTFVLLAAAPVQLQCLGEYTVTIVVADSLPSVGTAGFEIRPGPPVIIQPADAGSNVYAAMINEPVAVAFNIVSSQTG